MKEAEESEGAEETLLSLSPSLFILKSSDSSASSVSSVSS